MVSRLYQYNVSKKFMLKTDLPLGLRATKDGTVEGFGESVMKIHYIGTVTLLTGL